MSTAATNAPNVDVFTREHQEDPYPAYDWLRRNAPVYREPRFGGYLLTRYADVYGALRDHDTYSSAMGVSPRPVGGSSMGNLAIVTSDPPRHTHLRQLVNRAFTPRVVAAMRAHIEEIVRGLLDEVDGDGGAEFDFVQRLSTPLPVIVIAELLGVPAERRKDFKRWSDALVGSFDQEVLTFSPDVAEMIAYFASAYAERRTTPTADLLSALLAAEIEGEKLNDGELMSFAVILLVAGNETTTNLLGNLVNILVDRPDLWAAMREDGACVPAAVEEVLRFDSPVQLLARGLKRDVELHGTTMAAGSKVLVSFGSANRDADEWPEADDFRLDRNLSRHVAFGHGIHYCLGAPLARMEAEVAISAIIARYGALERGSAAGQRLHSTVIRGFEHLPVSPIG